MQAQKLGAAVGVACALLGASTVGAAPGVQALKDLSIES
jgi:hypothetical protein